MSITFLSNSPSYLGVREGPKAFFEHGGGFEKISQSKDFIARRFSRPLNESLLNGEGLKRIGGALSHIDKAFRGGQTRGAAVDELA